MGRLANRSKETAIAIADLLRVPTVNAPGHARDVAALQAAMAQIPPEQDCRCILEQAAIERLFAAVPDDTYVSVHLAAAYLDRSAHTFQKQLRAQYNRPGKTPEEDKTWQGELRGRTPADLDVHGQFRWGFVRACRDALEVKQKVVRTVRGQPTFTAFLAELTRRHRFVKDPKGNVLCAWGQGGISAAEIMAALQKNGRLALMTPMEALTLPWTHQVLRAPWQEAVDAGLATVTAALGQGDAATQAQVLGDTMGEAPPAPGRVYL